MDAEDSSSTSTASAGVSEPDSEIIETTRGRGRRRGQGRQGRGRGDSARGRGVGGVASARGRGHGGVASARGRGRGGMASARGRGRGGRARVSQSDRERVQERFRQKSEELEIVVKRMPAKKLRELVLQLVRREPGMVFDLVDDGWAPPPQPPQLSGSLVPSWCRCNNCVEMNTELERKCCGCKPEHCVSQRDQMERICLDPEVLAIGQAYYRDMLGRHNQRVEEYNRTMRHSGYRNFTLWRHGRLGAGVRRVIPSCCVWAIRNKCMGHQEQVSICNRDIHRLYTRSICLGTFIM